MNPDTGGVMFDQTLPGNSSLNAFDIGNITTHLSPNILFSGLALLAIVMGGVTIVLYYHWLRYGFGDKMVLFAQVLYTTVLLLSFIVMLTSATYYA